MAFSDPGEELRTRAAHWAQRMTDLNALGESELAQFHGWLAQNQAHERAFNNAMVDSALPQDLPAEERAHLESLAPVRKDERARSRRQIFRWSAFAATVIAVLIGAGVYIQSKQLFGETAYVTRTGETRVVTFGEDSVAYMNTRTELSWAGSGNERRVRFTEGEALFDISHDAAHPFSVVLDNSEIRVLGTRFNVYRKPNGDTQVTVLDGTVEVRGLTNPQWVRTLHANDQIEYRTIGLIREPHPTEAQNTVLWRSGIYKFTNETIEHVLDELTRYTDHKIWIRDPRIAQRHIGGALSTRDIRGALQRLESFAPIEVKENNGDFTLDYRADATERQE